MRLARCEKGHYYDKDKFTACPHCSGMQIAPGETVAFEDNSNKKSEEIKSEEIIKSEEHVEEPKKVEVEDRVPFSAEKAASFQTEEIDLEDAKTENPDESPIQEPAYDEMKTIKLDEEEALVPPSPEQVKAEEEAEAEKRRAEIERQRLEAEIEAEQKKETETAEIPNAPFKEATVFESIEDMDNKSHDGSLDESKDDLESHMKVEDSITYESDKPNHQVQEEVAEKAEEKAPVVEEAEIEEAAVAEEVIESEEEIHSLKAHIADVVASRIPDDTLLEEERNTNPVIGYLIGLDGPHRGNSYNVREGRNFIGRSTAMDICLAGNQKISRDKHAIITFDPRSKKCFLQPEESRELVYINDDLVLGPQTIVHDDEITMGEEQFLFLRLKSDKVDWI